MNTTSSPGLDGLPADVLDRLVRAEPRSVVKSPSLDRERTNLALLRWRLRRGDCGGPTEGAPS